MLDLRLHKTLYLFIFFFLRTVGMRKTLTSKNPAAEMTGTFLYA